MPEVSDASAVAALSPTLGNTALGVVTFTRVADGVRVVADVTGLTPGAHGFHIHERGDCSAPDASSAGGHFDPAGHPHGLPGGAHRHAGDFGNLVADERGHARLDRVFPDLHLTGGPGGILDKGVIVHVDPDDGSQPTGNAGARAACGVIGQHLTARASVAPTAGHTAQGTVDFARRDGGTLVTVRLSGVPTGPHGFHVHEHGDCSAPDASSAGGHFNPEDAPHGLPNGEPPAGHAHAHHPGDMGNVVADAAQTVIMERFFPHLRLDGPHSVLGRAVILHEDADDGSQPTGNAGGRIGCGRILPFAP